MMKVVDRHTCGSRRVKHGSKSLVVMCLALFVRVVPMARVRVAICMALAAMGTSGPATAQNTDNPVFPDVSPLARDGLASVPGLVAAENWPEAVRTVQAVLDEHADRVLELPGRRDVFVPVRQRVHSALLSRGELLDRYRRIQEPIARLKLEAGEHALVEHTMFMTSAGYEATLRVAEDHLRSARFEAARMCVLQLADHPDQAGERAEAAAAVLLNINRFLNRPELRAAAREWVGGELEAGEAIEWPDAATVRSFDPALPAGVVAIETLTGSPLRSVSFGERAVVHPARSAGMDIIPPAWVFPLVIGDRVFLNDGYRVTAFDRYSLRAQWVSELSQELEVEVQSMRINEPTSLAYAPGLILGATGVVGDNGERWGDPRLHAVDIDSGERRWSVRPVDLDGRLRGAIFRGPPVIEGDIAVALVRRADPTLRATSVFMVGISLADGSARWVRSIASAGSVGYSREIAAGDWLTIDRGVVYMTDRAGAVAAVEAATGRTRWIRLDTSPPRRSGARAMTWAVQKPIVQDEDIVVLSSDRSRVLWIDQQTGELAGSIGTPPLDDTPQCLVRVDDATLAVVSHASLGLIDADPQLAEASAPRLTGSLDEQGLTGRPFAIGGRLLAPVQGALVVVDPAQPRLGERIAMEGAGNAIAIESQLLMTDDRTVRSYLVWDVAERVLRERLEADPTNPEPALTLAELAFRSGRPGSIIGAVDHALAIIEGLPEHPLRERAYETILSMLEIGGSSWVYDGPASRSNADLAFDGFDLPEQLLDRLVQVSSRSQQRVSIAMLTGRLAEAREQAARAVGAYQSIVLDPELAGSVWSSRALTIGAGREATRRLREVVLRFGPGAYAEYEARARRELASAGGRSDPASVAARYPVASAAAAAWLRAADNLGGSGAVADELAALDAGTQVVLLRSEMGDPVEPVVAGEIAGRTLTRLVDLGRLASARRTFERFEALPALALTSGGRPVDAAALLADVGERLGQRGRLPEVGATLGSTPQLLKGWRLAPPMSGTIASRPDDWITMIDDRQRLLGVFEPSRDGASLERRWERPFDSVPHVLHAGDQRVLAYTESEAGRYIETIDAVSGQSLWRVGPINPFMKMPEDPRPRGGPMRTPLDGWRQPDDLLIAMDSQTLVLAARNGLTAAFSLDDGRALWNTELPLDRVVDLSVAEGQVVAVGDKAIGPQRNESRILLHDARTGEAIHQIGQLVQPFRWAQLTEQGLILAGVDVGLLAVRTRTGSPAWTASERLLSNTFGGWVLNDRLLVVGENGDLALGDIATGQFAGPLTQGDNRGVFNGLSAWRDGDRVVVATDLGVCIYNLDGRLIATDGLVGLATLLMPAAGAGVTLITERDPVRAVSGNLGYRIRLIDTTNGKLMDAKRLNLPEPPALTALLDGMAIISTPSMSVVLPLGK